jgi:hypothetical protein
MCSVLEESECDTDHYVVTAKVAERLSITK